MKDFLLTVFGVIAVVGWFLFVVGAIRWMWKSGSYYIGKDFELKEVVCEEEFEYKNDLLENCRIELDTYKKLCED